MIVSPTKQGIHDRFAKSALVRPAGQSNRWAVGCVWLLIIVTVVEVVLVVALFSIIGSLGNTNAFPPGTNPFDYFAGAGSGNSIYGPELAVRIMEASQGREGP